MMKASQQSSYGKTDDQTTPSTSNPRPPRQGVQSALSFYDRFGSAFSDSLNDYRSKAGQLEANLGWCFAANNAIAEPTAAVRLKLTRKTRSFSS
jgi:hypothetical protein